jgi:DNA-directed RNA polymerase subunit RPC12/RpoP
LPEGVKLILENCPPSIIEQVNHIKNFLGDNKIKSFYAPYFCSNCKTEHNIFFEVKNLPSQKMKEAPEIKCPQCQEIMEFEEVEEEYFSFLNKNQT